MEELQCLELPVNGKDQQEPQNGLLELVKEVYEEKVKAGVSKYDFFKVKITSGSQDSYSLLSRFMISRIFTSVGVSSEFT